MKRKKLSLHTNHGIEPSNAPVRARGVTRDRISFDGTSVFHVVDREGRLRFRLEVSKNDDNRDTHSWLYRRLDEIDSPAPEIALVDNTPVAKS